MQIMALISGIGLITTLVIPEPTHQLPPPKSLLESFWLPLKDFFQRDGAWAMILFILLFKIGDSLAGNTLMKFYNDLGYTKVEIAFWAKSVSILTAISGGLIGGIIVKKFGLVRSLVLFGILQAASTAGFALLASSSKDIYLFGAVIGFEDLTSGMGSAAFLAFMAHLTNTRFSATQYALLSSLASLPSRSVSAGAGWIQELAGGWLPFFILCAGLATPGILMVFWMKRYQQVTESNQR
jgi:PAT family beta-lactamase induction signal transducer AmpG